MKMDYEITEERQRYLEARGYTILSACPGSGKTTSIVYKLHYISTYCKSIFGKHTGFACLSFTNKACDEINEVFEKMHGEKVSFPNIVSTVDSFITQNIVLPYWYLFPNCKTCPNIVNDHEILQHIYYHESSPSFIFKNYYDLFYSYPPQDISLKADGYYCNAKKMQNEKEIEYCNIALRHRFNIGVLTSQDVLYMAYYLINKYDFINNIIINRFPYIIVDEVQDNSLLQFYFFITLRNKGLKNLEFVGDVCQSIYEFRDACPEYFNKMIESGSWNVLHFLECRRSNQRIINLYSRFKPKNMPYIHSLNVIDQNIPIVVYKYNDNNIGDIITDFNNTCKKYDLKDNSILARGDSIINKFNTNKKNGFNYWKSKIPYLLIKAKQLYKCFDFNSALKIIRYTLAIIKYGEKEYKKTHSFIKNIENDVDYNVKIIEFLKQIPTFTLSFKEWTDTTQDLMKVYWNLQSIDFQVYKSKKGFKISEISSSQLSKYFYDTYREIKNPIHTIHSVKGASFDAVLLFLSENSKGQNISLKDFPKNTIIKMTEKQRMIYVACSRAKQFLAIAIKDNIDNSEIKKAFEGIEFKLKEINIPGSLF